MEYKEGYDQLKNDYNNLSQENDKMRDKIENQEYDIRELEATKQELKKNLDNEKDAR